MSQNPSKMLMWSQHVFSFFIDDGQIELISIQKTQTVLNNACQSHLLAAPFPSFRFLTHYILPLWLYFHTYKYRFHWYLFAFSLCICATNKHTWAILQFTALKSSQSHFPWSLTVRASRQKQSNLSLSNLTHRYVHTHSKTYTLHLENCRLGLGD